MFWFELPVHLAEILEGAYAHYEADTLGLANGATVTTWPDISGNGHDLGQFEGAARPTYATNSLNGMGGVVLGAAQQIGLAVAGPQDKTVFWVMQNPTQTGINKWVSSWRHTSGTTQSMIIVHATTSGRWIIGTATPGNNWLEFTDASLEGNPGLWTFVHRATGALVRTDQVQRVTGNLTMNTPSGIVIGDVANSGSGDAIVYEFIVFTGALSAGDIDQVEDYLFNKWFVAGGQDVPVGAATEVEVANPITPLISREVTVGQAVEVELGQTIDPQIARRVTVNQASETELGQSVTPVIGRMVPVGTAAEVEAANPVTPRINRAVTIGIATEVELARLISPIKPIIVPVQTAVERELARLVTPFKGQPFIPGITCEVLTLGVDCAILALNVDCEQP